METDANFKTLISISFRVLSKVAPPPGTLTELPQNRHSKSTAPFIHLTNHLVNEPLTKFPNGTQME